MSEYTDRMAERVAIIQEANNQTEPPPKDLLDYAELVTQMHYARSGMYRDERKNNHSS